MKLEKLYGSDVIVRLDSGIEIRVSSRPDYAIGKSDCYVTALVGEVEFTMKSKATHDIEKGWHLGYLDDFMHKFWPILNGVDRNTLEAAKVSEGRIKQLEHAVSVAIAGLNQFKCADSQVVRDHANDLISSISSSIETL